MAPLKEGAFKKRARDMQWLEVDSIIYYIIRACFKKGIAHLEAISAATAASLRFVHSFLCEHIFFCVNMFDNADADTFSVIFNKA